jgi:hypothetical protein
MLSRRLEMSLLAAGALLLGSAAFGCASSSSEGKRYVVICDDKPLTGSHIGRPRCYRRTAVDDRREADREQIRRLQGPKMQPQMQPQDRRPPAGR